MAFKLDSEMTFLEHLEELRWHLIRVLIAIVIFTIASFIVAPWVFDHIIFAPARTTFPTFQWMCALGELTGYTKSLCVENIPFQIQSRYMTGQFTMHITASMVMGVIITFPYAFWEVWSFVRPGLYKTERSASTGAVIAVSFLFALGILFGYYILCPISVYFLATYQISPEITNYFDITSYVSTVVTLVLGAGLLFQLPIVVYFLTRIGLVSPAFLRRYRRHAIVIILVLAAILTPPDPFSQIVVSIPLLLLYEFSIFVSRFVQKREEKEEGLGT